MSSLRDIHPNGMTYGHVARLNNSVERRNHELVQRYKIVCTERDRLKERAEIAEQALATAEARIRELDHG